VCPHTPPMRINGHYALTHSIPNRTTANRW
jgi:hypothetical protein